HEDRAEYHRDGQHVEGLDDRKKPGGEPDRVGFPADRRGERIVLQRLQNQVQRHGARASAAWMATAQEWRLSGIEVPGVGDEAATEDDGNPQRQGDHGEEQSAAWLRGGTVPALAIASDGAVESRSQQK